jgi:hypothetical protein
MIIGLFAHMPLLSFGRSGFVSRKAADIRYSCWSARGGWFMPHSHFHQSPISAPDASNAVLRQTRAAQPLSCRLPIVQISYRRPQSQSMASVETSHDVANTPLLSMAISANFLIFYPQIRSHFTEFRENLQELVGPTVLPIKLTKEKAPVIAQ